jgi:D-alanyl-D-alanine carboxypeptidase
MPLVEVDCHSESGPAYEAVPARLHAIVCASRVPGIQFAAVTADKVLLEYCDGWADIAVKKPIVSATTLMAYSMSKPFTAAAVLQLADSGNIELDASLDDYVDCSPYGREVTVRRLLAHTAGVPNPIPLSWVHSPQDHPDFDERAALIARMPG